MVKRPPAPRHIHLAFIAALDTGLANTCCICCLHSASWQPSAQKLNLCFQVYLSFIFSGDSCLSKVHSITCSHLLLNMQVVVHSLRNIEVGDCNTAGEAAAKKQQGSKTCCSQGVQGAMSGQAESSVGCGEAHGLCTNLTDDDTSFACRSLCTV